jgi:hypothetical protein
MSNDFLSPVVARLAEVPGVEAVVLGGSRAQGGHAETSDWDLGLYYESADAFNVVALNRVAATLDDAGREDLCTRIGGWGPWVVGGGWLTIGGRAVDLIYREIPRVASVIDDCRAGRFTIEYQAGHPAGYPSHIYMAEAAVNRPLHDPRERFAALAAAATPYPPALRAAILSRMRGEPAFCMAIAEKGLARGDLAYVATCLARAVFCLAQLLFALNGEWYLNEKGAMARAGRFPRTIPRLDARVQAAFAGLGRDPAEAVGSLRTLADDVVGLTREG